eukprot:m.20323 g.20323  ORF g.20323 m.20323 type:complete len:417 (-) comp5240_c0_seq1:113-1363(-)
MGQKASRQLKNPIVDPQIESGSSNDGSLSFGSYGIQGYRYDMEDREVGKFNIFQQRDDTGFFGVFDGHGGSDTSFFLKSAMAREIETRLLTLPADVESRPDFDALIKQLLTDAFIACDDLLEGAIERLIDEMEHDDDEPVTDSGSTAVGVLILEKHIIFANVGDSRAVFVQNGKIAFTTEDHKPNNGGEKKRIKEAGGFVAHGRVCSSLAVSRAFGDFAFKQDDLEPEEQMVTCIPDITIFKRKKSDEFIILACDGVWDVLTAKTAVSLVSEALLEESELANVPGVIVKDALFRNSSDNITAMVVVLPGANRLSNMPDLIDEMFTGLSEDSPLATVRSQAKEHQSHSVVKKMEDMTVTPSTQQQQQQQEQDLEPTKDELLALEHKLKTMRKGKRRGRPRLDKVFQLEGMNNDEEEI